MKTNKIKKSKNFEKKQKEKITSESCILEKRIIQSINLNKDTSLFEDEAKIVVTFDNPSNTKNGIQDEPELSSQNSVRENQPNNCLLTNANIELLKEKFLADLKNEEVVFQNKLTSKLQKIRKTILFPNSILETVQTIDLENQLIGKLARQFCIYKINSVMVFNDEAYAYKKRQSGHDPSEFIVKILQYLETPQYLRKQLFPISLLLKNAGLLNPLDCRHHLKINDISEYREGVILRRPVKEKDGSWADIGLHRVK